MGLNKFGVRGSPNQTMLVVAVTATVTLTEDQAQAEVLKFTGSAGAQTVQFPWVAGSAAGKGEAAGRYCLVNNASNGNLTFKGYATDGTTPTTGLAVTAAKRALVYWDGTDFVALYQEA